jgi:hypothetical protein
MARVCFATNRAARVRIRGRIVLAKVGISTGSHPEHVFRAMRQAGRRHLVLSGSFARSRAWPVAAALAVGLVGAHAPAEAGDGSGTDNPALLRGTIGFACADGEICAAPRSAWLTNPASRAAAAPQTGSPPGNCVALNAAGIVSADCTAPARGAQQMALQAPKAVTSGPVAAHLPAPIAVQPPQPAIDLLPTGAIISPETPGDDAVTGDWSVSLKGSSTWDGRGQRYKIIVGPRGELVFHRVRGDLRLAAGLDLSYTPGGSVTVDGGSGAIEFNHALARDLTLKAALTLDGSREAINAVTSPSDAAIGALSVLGGADVEVERRMGRMAVALGASVSREYVGDTGLVDGTFRSNAASSWLGFGLSARAGYQLTPILSVYLEGKADRAYYDAIATGTGARADNWTYQGTLGLAGKWSNGLEAELYGGYGVTQYDSGLLTSGGGYVVGGSLSYPVLHRGKVTASLDTSLTPTDSVAGASTKIAYAATLGGSYLVSDWLTLRSALGGNWSVYPGSASYTETGLSANAGLDWAFGTHTALTADYTLGADWTPSASGLTHQISVGLTVSR